MEPPAIGANEAERLAVLRSYGILDTPPEPRFDALTKLAANILKVPVALITFIDTDRQWFKSRYGLDAPETPRDVSFCGHVVANEAPLVVPDALRDPRFSDNPLVTGDPIVRFYAGVPLKTPDGFFLGTFCAIDHEARENDGTEVETLELLAGQVVEILELQRQHTQSERQLRDELVVSGLRLEQLETHRQFFDLTLDLLCTVNSSLYFEQLNPMWEEVLGWTLDELRARPLLEFVHSDDLERTEAEAARLLAEASTTINFENRYRHKDGSWVPLSWVARARDGVFFCAARDMTSYYATARALQASEARLRAIIDTAVDAILTFDESGCIERANPAIERIFGHSASELVGQNVTVLMPAPGGEPNASYLANYVEAGPGEAIGIGREVTGRHKDGTLFPAELVISEMLVDGQKLFTGIIRDVSLRKQAERELNQFRVTLDRTNEAILIFDPVDLRFTYANHGAVKHLGYSIDELLQKTPLDLKPEFDEAQYREVLESLITGQSEATTFETVHRHKDGHDIPVEIVLQFMAPPGELPRFINIVRDISERKRLDRLTAEFVSMVSHELRTPLTSIRGSLGLVANGVTGQLPPQAQEYVGIALSNCERLVRLINDILDVEKIQSGKTVLRLQPVDLVEVVRKALATNEAFARAHNVTLLFVEEVPDTEVLVDEDRLIQVLTNLISNAAKFSPAGESVELSMVKKDNRIRVNVRDKGPGISAAFAQRIFQRFAQEDASSTRMQGGTGLGLNIAKTLIEAMQGEIGFETAPGGGTTFFFNLPTLPPPQQVTNPSRGDNNKRILVCEDDLDIAHFIQTLLEQVGCIADIAPTLKRARELLATYRYRVVTLDLMLADGEASNLIFEIRSSPLNADAPVIVISGVDSGQLQKLGNAAAMVADIQRKPINEERLLTLVSHIVAQKETHVRVLHVEDDGDLRQIVKRLLPEDWEIVEAATAARAKALLDERPFDLILLDLSLPDGSGDTLLELAGSAEVVIFSASDAPSALTGRVTSALVKSRTTEFQLRDQVVALMAGREAKTSL